MQQMTKQEQAQLTQMPKHTAAKQPTMRSRKDPAEQLQSTIGNHGMLRRLGGNLVQPKLIVMTAENRNEREISLEQALHGGRNKVQELPKEEMSRATVDQRVKMLKMLISSFWTGPGEEEAIIRVLETTPDSQVPALLDRLTARQVEGVSLEDELDKSVGGQNNATMHELLSWLRMLSVKPKELGASLQSSMVLPFHEGGMGFGDIVAKFDVNWIGDKTVRVRYYAASALSLMSTKKQPFADEVRKLPVDFFKEGHDLYPDQIVIVHDYGEKTFVPFFARNLLGYYHSGIRGTWAKIGLSAGYAASAMTFGAGGILAKSVEAAMLVLDSAFILIDDNRLNLVEWFPQWGNEFLYYKDLIEFAISCVGLPGLLLGGGGILLFRKWGTLCKAKPRIANQIAEKVADRVRNQADDACKEAEILMAELSRKPGALLLDSPPQKSLKTLLTPDGSRFADPDLEALYGMYRKGRKKLGGLSRMEWARRGGRGGAKDELLQKNFGLDSAQFASMKKQLTQSNLPAPNLNRATGTYLDQLENGKFKDVWRRSLVGESQDFIDAIQHFRDKPGFTTVMKEFLGKDFNKSKGARHVISEAYSIPEIRKAENVQFELRIVRNVVGERHVDVWADGIQYEFKSIKNIGKDIVRGRAKSQLGQLQIDMISSMGRDFSAIGKHRRTVFNGEFLIAGLKDTEPELFEKVTRLRNKGDLENARKCLHEYAVDRLYKYLTEEGWCSIYVMKDEKTGEVIKEIEEIRRQLEKLVIITLRG